MLSSLKMEYQVFHCIFQKNSAMAKVAIAVWKMQKKSGVMKSGLDAMPLFLLDDLLSHMACTFFLQAVTEC